MIPFKGSAESWNRLIASLPMPHLLQTWEWSQVKSQFGWEAMPFLWSKTEASDEQAPAAAAMMLKRSFPVRGFARKMCVLYIPKGPNLDWQDKALRGRVLEEIQGLARRQGAIFVKMDPDIRLGSGVPGREDETKDEAGEEILRDLMGSKWSFSRDQIQFRNTVLIDLAGTEDEILARMKQKSRYNIRVAQRKGVTIRPGTSDDLSLLYRMYAETSIRDSFLIRGEDYYQAVWRIFGRTAETQDQAGMPLSEPLIAEVEGEAIAAASLFYFSGQAYYLFGMSRQAHREKMPNYLIQWEAIRRAKELGCKVYNLWGAPDEFNETDGLWNVFRFKEGLGGSVLRTIGAWDHTPAPLLYRLYTEVLPRVMDMMRVRGNIKTRRSMGV